MRIETSAMEASDGGWEDLRKEARKIEGDLDVKLSSYAKVGGMLAHGGQFSPSMLNDSCHLIGPFHTP